MSRALCRPLFRLAVALFALWIPVVSGSGGRATAVAMHGAAKSWTAERPHLSCHGSDAVKKDCCCRGKTTLRAAACGCHDGDPAFGSAPFDPTVGAKAYALRTPSIDRLARLPERPAFCGVDRAAPDSPPPKPAFRFI